MDDRRRTRPQNAGERCQRVVVHAEDVQPSRKSQNPMTWGSGTEKAKPPSQRFALAR